LTSYQLTITTCNLCWLVTCCCFVFKFINICLSTRQIMLNILLVFSHC